LAQLFLLVGFDDLMCCLNHSLPKSYPSLQLDFSGKFPLIICGHCLNYHLLVKLFFYHLFFIQVLFHNLVKLFSFFLRCHLNHRYYWWRFWLHFYFLVEASFLYFLILTLKYHLSSLIIWLYLHISECLMYFMSFLMMARCYQSWLFDKNRWKNLSNTL